MIIDSPIISGSYAASGSLNQVGNITITGSLIVTGDITGNITGSATNAVSASFAATATSASYAANATSASYAAAATSASYANNATSASYALNSTSASYAANATSASYAANSTSASFSATASYLSNYIPPFPYTGSADISGSLSVNGNITSTGTLTAQTLIVQTITSSVDFVTGSTHFGSIIDNTHQFTGSVTISGSLAVNGSSAILTNQTGAMSVATASYVANAQTASYVETAQTASFVQTAQTASFVQNAQTASFVQNAQTASYVLNAISASFAVSSSYALTATSASNALTASYLSGYVSPFPYTGSAIISGSLEVTGSANLPNITGSLLGTASFANTATSASFATTASFALNVPVTASYANNAATASYWSGSIVNAATASFAETASFVTLAQTASFVQTAQTASFVQTAQTASFVVTAQTASFVQTAQTASYVLNAVSSSFATSASNALTASYLSSYVSPFPFTGSAIISGSLIVTGSVAVSNLGGSGVRYLVADESGSITAQSASAALKSTQAFTSTAGQTTFSVTNGYATGYVDVFINGSKLSTAEFTDTSGTNIVLATGSFVNDIVEVVKYTPAAGVTNNVLRQLTTFTASAGQTVFSASYTPGLIDIFYNGSRLSPADFTANNGTFFTLATGSAANDILDVLVYSYQVGAFSGIGGVGTATQVAYFDTTNSITGSPNFTISGSTMTITGSLIVSSSGTFTNIGPAVFSGSLTSTEGFTGSFSGTATSASYAANAELLDGLDSSVFATTSSNTFVGNQIITGSVSIADSASVLQIVGNTFGQASLISPNGALVLTPGLYGVQINGVFPDLQVNGNVTSTGASSYLTGSLLGTASYAANANLLDGLNSTVFATTGSNTFIGTQTISGSILQSGSFTTTGTITAQTLVVQTITSSVDFVTGSTRFGSILGNTHVFSGSVTMNPGGLFVSSSGNVGIGTINPTPRDAGALILELYGTSSGRSSIKFTNSTSGTGALDGMWMGYDDALNFTMVNNEVGHIALATSNTERMRITSAGVIGIGVIPTTWYTTDYSIKALQIGSAGALFNLDVTSSNLRLYLSNNSYVEPTSAAQTYIVTGAATSFSQENGAFFFRQAASGTAGTPITFTTPLTIASTGASTFISQVNAESFYTNDTRYISNQIMAGYNTNAEDSDIWINYTGYQGGTTRFRDFRVGNGKQTQIALFDGSTGAATFSSTVSTGDMVTIAISDISTGENKGLKLNNTGGGGKTWNITAGAVGSNNSDFVVRNSSDHFNALAISSAGAASFYSSITTPSYVQSGINIGINSSTATTLALVDCAMLLIRDASNGGSCLCFFEIGSVSIISQTGATVFTNSAPSANQIQLAVGAGSRSVTALGGSNRNGTQVRIGVFRNDGQ
jgi:hypothetical protein